jgi:hypothetical protein
MSHGVAVVVVAVALLSAQPRAQQPAAARPAPGPSEAAPLQCWWRSDAGAIRLGEVVEVTLTCAALERDDLRAVPDESRLTVAAIQMAPFEIVGGSHPPDLRSGDRRLFEYRYALRIIDADVIGRDVKLPPLAIPYRVESRVGAGTTLAGRDLVHLMPQLAFRVVSQVPADATDIRDASDASLARVDALRFRSSAFAVAAALLAALAGLVALSVVVPVWQRTRGGSTRRTAVVTDRAVLRAAGARLGTVLDSRPDGAWDGDALAAAHQAVRLIAAVASGQGVRQTAVEGSAPTPEGRLIAHGWLGRSRAAVTANTTPATLTKVLDGLPASASAHGRARLETLRDSLAMLTRAQYSGDERPDAAALADAVRAARDAADTLGRERRWHRRATVPSDPSHARTV